jgi:hypothetical protein
MLVLALGLLCTNGVAGGPLRYGSCPLEELTLAAPAKALSRVLYCTLLLRRSVTRVGGVTGVRGTSGAGDRGALEGGDGVGGGPCLRGF